MGFDQIDGIDIAERTSAVILAGGRSSRMGADKAALPFRGGTFLSRQTEKLRALGIRDIVIAGYPAPEGARAVEDILPGRGPLSGIHAGLNAVENDRALVLAVDTPLVPEGLLRRLMEQHRGGVTLASVNGRAEPLIGVYDKSLGPWCEDILRGSDTAVARLLRMARCTTVEFDGDASLLANCNTPEDYEKLMAYDAGCPDE